MVYLKAYLYDRESKGENQKKKKKEERKQWSKDVTVCFQHITGQKKNFSNARYWRKRDWRRTSGEKYKAFHFTDVIMPRRLTPSVWSDARHTCTCSNILYIISRVGLHTHNVFALHKSALSWRILINSSLKWYGNDRNSLCSILFGPHKLLFQGDTYHGDCLN